MTELRYNLNTALRRLSASYYVILDNPPLALELVGAAATSYARVVDILRNKSRELWSRAEDIRRQVGAIYAQLEDVVMGSLIDGYKVSSKTLEDIRNNIKSAIDKTITLYAEVVRKAL